MIGRSLKKFLVWIWRTVKVLALVVLFFVLSLFFREQKLPKFIVDRISALCSTSEFLIRFDTVHFGFRHGLRCSGVRLFDLRRPDSLERPVGSARYILADYFKRTVRISGAEYHKLPDSYYEETDEPVLPERMEFDIPEIEEFSLELENPRILGVEAEYVSGKVASSGRRITLSDIKLVLPDRDCKAHLSGDFEMDLDMQRIRGDLRGSLKQSQVRPLIEILDVQCALEYIDAFTGISSPIPANMRLRADLTTKDIALKIGMTLPECKYNSVPFEKGEGGIEFESFHENGKLKTRTKVFVPVASDAKGRRLSGWLSVDDAAGPYRIEMDVRSELDVKDAVSIIDIDGFDGLDDVRCDTPPLVTAKGVCATETSDVAANSLSGTFSFLHGAVNGFSMNDFRAEYTLKGDVLELEMRATGKTGGRISAFNRIDFEGFEDGKGRYETKGDYKDGSLEELADLLTFDLGERNGKVDWKLEMSGALEDETFKTLNGRGKLEIRDGHLAQMKLFAGLTELLAEKIPGVSFLVNQTQASCDYTIEDGIFKSDDIFIEGGLISIKGWGKYDIVNDNLDFITRVQFMKKESLVGKIVHPVTLPFTKLLLEFKVNGPLDDPQWKYVKILDRIF